MDALQPYQPQKPVAQLANEQAIRDALIAQNVPLEIAPAVIGYQPQEVPFIYRSRPNLVNGQTEFSALWMGSTDAIYNLTGDWYDQILEVIVQWWGHGPYHPAGEGSAKIERLEAHPLPDGSFIHLKYEQVSGMGAFDGQLVEISYNKLSGSFPYNGKPRRSYQIYYFERVSDTEWLVNLTNSWSRGVTILNAFEQMVGFRMGHIEAVKADFSAACRFSPLPESKRTPQVVTIQQAYESLLEQQEPEVKQLIAALFERMLGLMNELAPAVLDYVAKQPQLYDLSSSIVNGILQYPDKMAYFQVRMSDLPREHRFQVAQFTVDAIRQGAFTAWLKSLKTTDSSMMANAARLNTYHVLSWYMEKAPSTARFDDWLAKVEEGVREFIQNDKVDLGWEAQRCVSGMGTSYVECFIEAATKAQLHEGVLPGA